MNAAPLIPVIGQGPKSGILRLRDAVAAYFVEHDVPAVVAPVGLKYRSFQLNQANPGNGNRVVFIPGEFEGDGAPKPRKYGNLSRMTRNASAVVGNSRELVEWERPMTISVWAAPVPGRQPDEDQSIGVVENLLEEVVRGVHAFGHATIRWGEVTINAPPVENAFGAELLVSIIQIGPIYDVTYDFAQPNASVSRG